MKECISIQLIHFFWDNRLELTLDIVIDLQNQGMSLALMNTALTMLAVDLLVHEFKISAMPSFWA